MTAISKGRSIHPGNTARMPLAQPKYPLQIVIADDEAFRPFASPVERKAAIVKLAYAPLSARSTVCRHATSGPWHHIS